MAMLQMQRIYIYALKKDRKPILELLQRRGLVEISDVIPEDNVFQKTDMSYAKSIINKSISLAREAAEILERYAPEKKGMLSSLNGRKSVTTQEYDAFKEKHEATVRIANQIIAYNKAIAENKAEVLKLNAQVEMLLSWTDLDIPLGFSGTKYTKSFIGTLPKEMSLEEIYEILADFTPINVDIVSSTKEQTCIFVLCLSENAEKVYETLRAVEFSHPSITSDIAPREQLEKLKKRIEETNKEIERIQQEIISLVPYKEDLLFLQDYDKMRSDKYDVIGQVLQSKNVFVMNGYIPKRDAKAIEDELSNKFEVGIEFEDPSVEEDIPVLLSNNKFAQPVESVVEGFSLPGKGESDPTMIMALFYYLIFGIILADAGYGSIIVAVCGFCLIKYKKTIESSMKNFLTMFLYCGISTIFWGAMFGSYFGDLFDVIGTTYFGVTKSPLIPPIWFFPINKPMQMLTFSMALGIIHLLTGLGIKTYQLLRQKDYISILYDTLSWYALIISSIVYLLSMEMITGILGISFRVSSTGANIAAVIAVISSIIIIMTNGRESRNPFKRFLKGLFALYGITGYLSDVLSYSRLLALGLASGVICSVVNKMAGMAGKNGILGPLIFVLIVVLGHVLNFAINILGAYVHTNRLQYVEFFGKFYEGGGRLFNPFNMKTKYYKVKENMKNEYE